MRVPRLVNAGRHRSGRLRRGWSAVVLGVAGALVGTLVGAGPAAAAGVGTLRLTPNGGRPTTEFTISYQYPQQNGACAKVSFAWDRTLLGTARGAHGQRLTSPCLITLTRLTPPPDDGTPGPHTVTATFEGQARAAQAAIYTVLPGPTFSARFSPTPSRGASRGPTADASDDAVAGGVDTSQAAVAPLAAGAPSVADAASGGSGGGGLMSWVLIFGGLLVLGGIGIFGLLIYWTRRGGPGDHDADTQVIG